MRFAAAALLGLCFAMQGFTQAQATGSEPGSGEAYRRIEAVRASETAVLDAQEADCYQRFAVNNCLKNVQSRRRALLADLKRQETRLHEREHALQGSEALQRSAQKAVEAQQRKVDIQAGDGAAREQDKAQEQRDKQAAHAAKAASGIATIAAPVPGGPTAAEQAQAREEHVRKQADAEKKRQEVARRLAEKAAKPVQPLPVPP